MEDERAMLEEIKSFKKNEYSSYSSTNGGRGRGRLYLKSNVIIAKSLVIA